MNQRTLLDRLLSPAGFGLVLLLFLFPFATVSCAAETEQIDAAFTGLDFAIGGEPTVSGTNIDGDVGPELSATFVDFYQPDVLAILAAVLLLVGMAAALIQQRQLRATVSAAIAAVVVVLLAVAVFIRAPSRVADAMDWFKAEAGLDEPIKASTTPAIGFWLAIVLLIGLAAWQGYDAVRANTPVPVTDGPAPPAPPPVPDPPALDPAAAQESWRAQDPS